MQYPNEIFFFVLFVLSSAILFSGISLFRNVPAKERPIIWFMAVGFCGLAFLCLSLASSVSLGLLSFGNAFLFLSYAYFGIFCISLVRTVPNTYKYYVPIAAIIFLLIFEYLRQNYAFRDRVIFTLIGFFACVSSTLLVIYYSKVKKTNQIILLISGIFIQAVFLIVMIVRFIFLYFDDSFLASKIYEESPIVTFVRWMWFSSLIFSSALTLGFFAEIFLHEKNSTLQESARVKSLLKEKEMLVYRALKLNKTMSTGALTASLAHELNQPIAAIGLNVESLKISIERGSKENKFQLEILDALKEEAQHASQIIQALRNIFIDNKNDLVTISVKDVIVNTLVHISPALKAADIKMQMDIDENLIIKVNPTEIEQVVLNLLNNAMYALSGSDQPHPLISVEVIRAGDYAHLAISDNGPGISSDLMPNLFNLFESSKKNGMGLGLWLCKYIVTRNKGSIHCENTKGGAKFVVIFPV